MLYITPSPKVLQPDLQAWVLLAYFIALFSTAFVWRAWATYRSTGINPLVLANDESAHGYIGRSFKVVMVALFISLCAQAAAPPSNSIIWTAPLALQAIAWAGLACAWFVLLFAQAQMGSAWRIGIDTQHPTALITKSIFSWSRNPIFLSLRVTLACLLVLSPTPIHLALIVAAELLMQIQVRLEESHLLQLHGAHYRTYQQQVRRWL
jgi:protein-S-isoprenylcysteine O-methyltransferase Ste14